MKRLLTLLILIPSLAFGAVELDADGNGALDVSKGGVNTTDGSIPVDTLRLPSLQKLYFGADPGTSIDADDDGIVDAAFLPEGGGVGGYVSTPTYSNETCTVGQWSFDTSYVYICEATDQWDRYAVTFDAWSNPAPAPDTTPDAFSFTDQTDVATNSTITSEAITVAGINSPTTITVTGGTYDINADGNFVSTAGTVSNGDTVRARHTSSASGSTATDTVVTIGGVSDTFTSTTVAGGGGVSDNFSSNTAANYTAITGGVTVSGGVATGTTNWANNLVVHNTGTGSNNHYVQGTVQNTNDNGPGGLVIGSNGTTGYIAQINTANNRIELRPFSGATISAAVTNVQVGYDLLAATNYLLKVSRSGNVFTVYIDGVLVNTMSDSTYTVGDKVGMYFDRSSNGQNPPIDNLEGNAL